MSRDYRLQLRLSKEEYEALETAVAEQTLSKSDYIRITLFKSQGRDFGVRAELVSMRAELTQAIAHFKLKSDDVRYEALIASLLGCKEKITELIKRLEIGNGNNDT